MYGAEGSTEIPKLPLSRKAKEKAEIDKLKLPWKNPHSKQVRSEIECSRCCKKRLLFAQKKLSKENARLLADHMESITFQCGQSLEFPNTPDYKKLRETVFLDRRKKCDSHVHPFFYKRLKESDIPPCGWCPRNLSTDQVQKYKTLLEDNDTVIPNCGRQQCLHSASEVTSNTDGWLLKGANKKARALKRKQKAKDKRDAKRRKPNPS